jgi:hypothetical protein
MVGRNVVLHHFLDYAVFFPQRHENGDAFLRRRIEFGFRRAPELRAPGKLRRHPGAGARDVQHQIVQAVKKNPER